MTDRTSDDDATSDLSRTQPDPAVEADLVERVRRGDTAAFEVIFLTYSPAMRDFARRYIMSREEVAELIQDIFLAIWKNRSSWRVQNSLKAYLFRATRNAALNRMKHQRVVNEWLAGGVAEQLAPAADAALLDAELQSAIERALASLPERRRMALLLRWRDGLSHAEIAEVMGISVRTVENTLASALRDLRSRLAPWTEGPDR